MAMCTRVDTKKNVQHYVIEFVIDLRQGDGSQGQIQDFKLGGVHLK